MKQKDLLERLAILIKLCEDTEPSTNELTNLTNLQLFSDDLISVKGYYNDIKDDTYESEALLDIMKECNWIWKKRKRIKEHGWEEYTNVDLRIEKSLRGNRKIEAIKLYRQNIIDNGGDCGLKEAKEYIDKLVIRMGLD